jgi:hypothetical protein
MRGVSFPVRHCHPRGGGRDVMDDLQPEDIAYVRAVLDGLTEAVVRFGRPMPPSVTRARGILDRAMTLAMTCALSADGRGSDCGDGELESAENMIGTAELARMLSVTPRTARRRAEALGGQRISGAWVFDRDDIDDIGA